MKTSLKVSFVTTGNEGMASYRYRTACPALQVRAHLIKTELDQVANPDADIVVFSKHWNYGDWSYAYLCKERGQKVIFDVCDDHFSTRHEDHYRRMVDIADVVVCNSAVMAEIVQKETGNVATVIPDPVLSQRIPPVKGAPKLAWYGSSANVNGLYDVYTSDIQTPLEVVVPGPLRPPMRFNAPYISWSQWNPFCINEVVDRGAKIAILPYRQGKEAKSANRVLEALWTGMAVVTDPLPAVMELKTHGKAIQFFENGLAEAIRVYTEEDLTDAIAATQDEIAKEYSPQAIGTQWKNLFEAIV